MTEAHTMTDEELLDDVAELLSGDLSDLLATDDGTTASPPRLTGDAMVVCPVQLPTDLYLQVKAHADRHGIPVAALIRQWVEASAEMEDDRPISRADAMRALRLLRSVSAA